MSDQRSRLQPRKAIRRDKLRQAEESDGEQWEDIPRSLSASPTNEPPPSSLTPTDHLMISPRRRLKPLRRTKYSAATEPPSPPTTPVPQADLRWRRRNKAGTRGVNDGQYDFLVRTCSSIVRFTSRYTTEILKTAIKMLKIPLAYLLFFWFLAHIVSRLHFVFRPVLGPVCWLPVISRFPLCVPLQPVPSDRRPALTPPPPAAQWADYPSLVRMQSAAFEQLLDRSTGGSTLALELKKAEMATSDLATLVRASDELRYRDELATSLGRFIADARLAGRGLLRFHSKVASAVDGILAINNFALREIEEAKRDDSQKQQSFLSYFLRLPLRLLGLSSLGDEFQLIVDWFPMKPLVVDMSSGGKSAKVALTDTFKQSLDVLSTAMERLIVEAETNVAKLNQLEDALVGIHALVTRENVSLTSAQEEVLAEVWTWLGGNRKQLASFKRRETVLRDLAIYHQQARTHVVVALQTLLSMSEDMDELKNRVAAPELIEDRIPLEVHVGSIQAGLERLMTGRLKAKEREVEAFERILSTNE